MVPQNLTGCYTCSAPVAGCTSPWSATIALRTRLSRTGAPRIRAYASGFSFGEALRDGLAEVLLWHQARANEEADYAPAAVPPLPQRGRLTRVAPCPAWSADEATTTARLAQLGWTAVAVPLDHDPGVTASIMPYLVNVVLTHA